jgi:glycosyltransferase involved in cell wall biosynthesis
MTNETVSRRPILYIVDSSIEVTGGLVGARNIARIFNDYGDTVLVVPKCSKITSANLEGFTRIEYLQIVNLRKSFVSFLLYLPALLVASWRLRRMMEADGAKTLQLNDFFLMHGAMLRLLGYRGAIATWVRFDPRRFGRLLSGLWLRAIAVSSDEVVTVSRFVQSILPPWLPSRVIYDPVPDNLGTNTGQADIKEKTHFVYLGNYIEGKGQDDSLIAFSHIANKYPKVDLHFHGSDMGLTKNRAYLERLRAQTIKLGLAERVIFHGFARDVGAVLRTAYAALNFSRSETFSLTCLEASAAGLAVVATRSGGPEEIIDDERTGVLVPVGDVDAMAAAMDRLAGDPVTTRKMGEAGAISVRTRFSAEAFSAALHNLYKLEKQTNKGS